jgi:hypothetical protein
LKKNQEKELGERTKAVKLLPILKKAPEAQLGRHWIASSEDGVMMTPTRIVRLIGIMGLVGWLGMVGWVAKTTRAQQQPAPPVLTPAPGVNPAQPAGNRQVTPPASVPTAAAPAQAAPAVETQPPAIPDDPPADKAGAKPAATAGEPPASFPMPSRDEPTATASTEDPEKAAVSFVERSQKEAEEHLKVLTAEAAQLHGRLSKVEAGIKQWQSLLAALKSARKQAITATAPAEEPATALEPVAAENGRPDRRKWSSASSATAAAPGTEPAQGAPAAEETEAAPGTARVIPPATATSRPR